MRSLLALCVLLLSTGCLSTPRHSSPTQSSNAASPDFDARFTGSTLRVDYAHCGTSQPEASALVGYRAEGEWAGSRTQLVDYSDTGKYRFRMFDKASGSELYSRGFASIYGEWETTAAAKQGWGSFQECQRFPEPRASVFLALEKRGADGRFAEFWRTELDPQSRFVDRSPIPTLGEVIALRENGPSAKQVDLLIVADGYTAQQRDKFVADAKRLSDILLATQPFARHAARFSVRCLFVPTPESGISNPRKSIWKDSLPAEMSRLYGHDLYEETQRYAQKAHAIAESLRMPLIVLNVKSSMKLVEALYQYDTLTRLNDSDRYVLTYEDQTLRNAAAQAPYDALILLFNERKYGGGGIYNLWATVASDTEPAPYVFVHEFGHSFAGLADEYYSSQVAYEEFNPAGVEPWEPNATALLDPKNLKWKDLVDSTTPIPTPWNQTLYDQVDLAYQKQRAEAIAQQASEERNEELMREIKAQTAVLLATEPHRGKVGAFQGSMYEAKGLYRPEVDCIMFSRNPTNFCKVCERALERTILMYTE